MNTQLLSRRWPVIGLSVSLGLVSVLALVVGIVPVFGQDGSGKLHVVMAFKKILFFSNCTYIRKFTFRKRCRYLNDSISIQSKGPKQTVRTTISGKSLSLQARDILWWNRVGEW